MISVDYRKGSTELIPIIQRIGVPAERAKIPDGDAMFEGNGPKGKILLGFERKTLHDMLGCIDDARFNGKQRVGMMDMYAKSFLYIEGMWKPHENGLLMEGFPRRDGSTAWTECKYRSQRTMYSKLYRYLRSLSLSGVIITQSRDIYQTAYNLCEDWHYFQKPWNKHTSLLEIQKLNIPYLAGKPPLVRRWAEGLTDIGPTFGIEAQKLFKTGIRLATSDEQDWLRIKGVGVGTAQKIIKEIHEK